MEGRRLRGEGIENIQDYIEERMTEASDVDELAEHNQRLKGELHDLGGGSPQPAGDSSDDVLENTASNSVDSAQSPNAAATSASVGPVDPDQLPPTTTARSQVVNDMGGNQVGP